MKNFIIRFFILFAIVCSNQISVFANSDSENLKFSFVFENKTKTEFARTIIPENFTLSSFVKWERDFESPVVLNILAKPNDNSVFFLYTSQQSFSDTFEDIQDDAADIDNILWIQKKDFLFPQDYAVKMILKTNPKAVDIELVSSEICSNDVKNYLLSELLDEIDNLKTEAKSDRRYTKVSLGKPYIEPFVSTYTYKVGDETYKQTFIAMLSSVDYEFTKKTSFNKYEKYARKLWTVSDLYIYKAKIKQYDKYFDDFIIFVSNTLLNKKVEYAVKLLKQQLRMENSPTYIDIHTGSSLKNMPSELFARYYDGGLALYHEDKNNPVQKPSILQIKWFANIFVPQNRYKFVKIPTLWNQPVYVPAKYQHVYYNKSDKKFIISKTLMDLDKNWVQLKLANLYK